MIKLFSLIVLILILPVAVICGIPPQPKSYYCSFTNSTITIDGNLDEKCWVMAPWTDKFIDISGNTMPAPYFDTKVKLIWDDEYLYIGALIYEENIWANIDKDESVIYYDNDFEVFIDPDGDNFNYLEFEYNALNTWWDLYLNMPYRDFGIPMTSWTCNGKKSAVSIYGSINNSDGAIDSAWTIEIAIPFSCFNDVIKGKFKKPEVNDFWRMNFSRVEWRTKIVDGEYIKMDKPEDNWVWTPQYKVNMHMPEYWGYVVFCPENFQQEEKIFSDEYWEIKYSLMKLYEFQKDYFFKNGAYLKSKDELDSEILNGADINIETTSKQFIISINSGNITWYVNQKGKLWSEEL